MRDYYSKKLFAERLRQVYELAPPRVKRYLEAEIEFVLDRVKPSDVVLELGCGYGRALYRLATKAGTVVGIDTSHDSLLLARSLPGSPPSCRLVLMNALALGFQDRCFDTVICVQNGLSAFQVEARKVIAEAIRVTRSGGAVLLSSYAEHFWEERLAWFRSQARHGLLGEIDEAATRGGVIVCKDGFRATTFGPDDFVAWAAHFKIIPKITEVEGASLMCELTVP